MVARLDARRGLVRWGETIGVFGPDGERQTLLTVPPGMMAPRRPERSSGPMWLPDGASLLVKGGVVVPLDGSTPWKLPSGDPRSPATLPQATYSPDGSHVAYTSYGSLVVQAADGSVARHQGSER